MTNGVVALVTGCVVAVLLLIPVAAVQYRRDGDLRPSELGVLVGAAVYAMALWTYTLLPFPPTARYRCKGTQLELFGSVLKIGRVDPVTAQSLLLSPAFLQVVLNVLLFVPLGFFVRRIAGRGVVTATLLGFAISLGIETTQHSAVFGIFRCAYRLFDVDDLWINTLGALLGSLASLHLVRRRTGVRTLPTRITLGRRWMGMVADALAIALLGGVAVLAWRGLERFVLDERVGHVATALLVGVPLLAQAASVLVRGRTLGEWTVDLRTEPYRRGPEPLARLVKLATGVGPALLLLALPPLYAGTGLLVFAGLTAAAPLATRSDCGGLSNRLAGLRLVVDLPPQGDGVRSTS